MDINEVKLTSEELRLIFDIDAQVLKSVANEQERNRPSEPEVSQKYPRRVK